MTSERFDVAIVGSGIVGLGCALAAARAGLRAVVVDREPRPTGASIRNFGFVTVTGQQAGECWRRARRSRDIWAEIAPAAGIAVEHRGLLLVARRPSATAVLDEFAATEMGEACERLDAKATRARLPSLAGAVDGGLYSPHELRVESRTAIPKLVAWLQAHHGVELRRAAVHAAGGGRLETSRGRVDAERVVVCPGDDLVTLFPERIAAYGVTRCRLQMMRLRDPRVGTLPGSVMTDLSLVRYLGFAELPAAAPLARELRAEQAAELDHGVHLIVVQSADGSLVVGDSHHYDDAAEPFLSDETDALILGEYAALFGAPPAGAVVERWVGHYSSARDRLAFIDAPEPRTRLVMVTSGTGASTAFAIGEEVVASFSA